MFGGGASMALASIWTSIANWSTPTILFCFLNIMIATIFISSNFNHHHQLTRSPSLLERVKSVNLSSLYTSHDEHRVDDSYETTTGYNSVSQLSRRAPSLLQRVKSIDLSFSYFHTSVPTTDSEQLDKSSTSQLTRAPSLVDRVKSLKLTSPFINSNINPHFNDTNSTSASQDEDSGINPHHDDLVVEEGYDHDYVTSNNKFKSNKLANVSSEKEKCGLSRVRRAGSINVLKSRSEKGMMQQVESEEEEEERRRPTTMRESSSVVVDSTQSSSTCVDAKADDFIKRFKQQLKLQRIDSLQRFREMLNRGT